MMATEADDLMFIIGLFLNAWLFATGIIAILLMALMSVWRWGRTNWPLLRRSGGGVSVCVWRWWIGYDRHAKAVYVVPVAGGCLRWYYLWNIGAAWIRRRP